MWNATDASLIRQTGKYRLGRGDQPSITALLVKLPAARLKFASPRCAGSSWYGLPMTPVCFSWLADAVGCRLLDDRQTLLELVRRKP
jgi:hypothetical protein